MKRNIWLVAVSIPACLVLMCGSVLATNPGAIPLVGNAIGAVPVKFANPELLTIQLDKSPKKCVAALESILTQAQANELEAVLAPPAWETLARLKETREKMRQDGLSASHKAIVEMDIAILAAENDAALEAVE